MRRRWRVGLALAAAGLAAVGSAADEREAPVEVFSSIPGPPFRMTDNITIVDWFITLRATPESFPPIGDWRERFSVEIDFEEAGRDLDDRTVVGRLARVAPGGRTVLSSTTTAVGAGDRATLVLVDEQGFTPCIETLCEKRYVLRLELLGLGNLSARWFLQAAIDWARGDLEVPERAGIAILTRLL